jgi:hypothetical protein
LAAAVSNEQKREIDHLLTGCSAVLNADDGT